MKVFSDKSIIEQETATISDCKTEQPGISITVLSGRDVDATEVVFTREELVKALIICDDYPSGEDRLWGWWELSYASFLTMPRVLMHAMPDNWKNQMAALLEEYDEMYPNQPDIGTQVQAVKDGKLTKMPEFLKNYQHPDYAEIEKMKSS